MDEERQETADWRIVWQMFFPCVISDLIGGCVEVLGHLEGNVGRTVSSFLTFAVIYPFYWRRIQKKKENRRIAEADGMKEQVSPQIKTTKEEKCGYFWEKVPDVWKSLLGAAAFSAVFNMIFWALEKKEIFLGVLHIAVQKVRMTGQAAEAVSLCLKMLQGDMLAATLRRRAPPLYFPAPCGSSSFSWALPPHFPKNCCFAAFYLSACVWRSHFSGRHLDRRHFSGWCMETGRRGFMRRSWD